MYGRTGKKNPMYGRRGEKCPNWKGGISPLHRWIRALPEYLSWRNAVFIRDMKQCVVCGSRKNIQAHHIKPLAVILAQYKIRTVEAARNCVELWSVTNGKTLCENCHQQTDSYKGKALVLVRRV